MLKIFLITLLLLLCLCSFGSARDLTPVSIKTAVLGGGHIAHGSFARYIHANGNFLWISNHVSPTGQTPVFDLRASHASGDANDIVELGNFCSWGTYEHLVAHKDPMLNVEGTNIFTISDHNDGYFYTFDISNFMDFVDAGRLQEVKDYSMDNYLFQYNLPGSVPGYGIHEKYTEFELYLP